MPPLRPAKPNQAPPAAAPSPWGGVRTETTVIDGEKYSLNVLPASQGLPLLTWILSVVSEPIGGIAAGALRAGKGPDADPLAMDLSALPEGVIESAIRGITASLADPATTGNVQALLSGLTVGGLEANFDLHFAGRYLRLAKVIAWAIRINYADFFVGGPLGGLGPLLAQSTSPRPKDSPTTPPT